MINFGITVGFIGYCIAAAGYFWSGQPWHGITFQLYAITIITIWMAGR
jgi:hypothetical protein